MSRFPTPPVLTLAVATLLLVSAVQARCAERVMVNGVAEMLCIDEVTGIGFTYTNLSDRFGPDL